MTTNFISLMIQKFYGSTVQSYKREKQFFMLVVIWKNRNSRSNQSEIYILGHLLYLIVCHLCNIVNKESKYHNTKGLPCCDECSFGGKSSSTYLNILLF